MSLTIYQVDAFTAKPFGGNPAGVCLLPQAADDAWMQHVAQEMNLSETAFLLRRDDGFGLRWFTPAYEVELCGHATLASAHILWETGELPRDAEARFHTLSGLLKARSNGDWIEMDFPAEPVQPAPPPPGLIEALAVTPLFVGRNRMDYFVQVESADVVRSLQPDMTPLAKMDMRGVIVTAKAPADGTLAEGGPYDFVSRFFAPGAGVPEDPVTGSAHCALGPFWGEKLGKRELLAYQASRRGGVVRVALAGDRVLLGGQAITVIRGELLA
ncbi:MAG: PhzF family phenazine biosynthesis protein [Anaerolineae bacterium]